MTLAEILARSPVIPVVTLDDPALAAPLGRAIAAGGLKVVEVTLRTPRALEAVAILAREAPELITGAGTVLDAGMRLAAAEAGAAFAVSPGLIPDEPAEGAIPLLPGVATATELMAGLALGFDHFKLFPAHVAGGPDALKALSGPFPQARFCPTGGVTPESAGAYLALPNVACVGGSWIVPADALAQRDWARITALSREAAALRRS